MELTISFLAQYGHIVAAGCLAAALLVVVLLVALVIRDIRARARRRSARPGPRAATSAAERPSRSDLPSLGR
jgi:hypothetical protein